MGNAFTTTNNTSPTLYLAGNTLPNPITVANDATTGTYTIGSVTDQSSVFSGPITLNQPLTVTMITSQFFSSLSLSGGITSSNGTQTVTFAGPGSIYVSTTGITGAVAVNVSGGTTTLLVANGYTGPTNVVGGVLISGLSGAIPAGNNMTIGQGATFVADSQGTVSGLGSLNLNGNLDVQNGSLSTLTAEVAVGYNNGAWNGSGTAPVAITSSTAASDTTHLHAIGVIQNSVDQTTGGAQLYPTFEGQTVANTDVLVKYTYYGDANLSGAVDASDYSLIDNGYLNQLTGWYNGDFNYDGVVNGSDYTLIDNAYNMQGGQISSEIASATAQDASPSAVVPEPATLGLLGFSAVGLLHRGGRLRRRK
jgi:hypothetical protein